MGLTPEMEDFCVLKAVSCNFVKAFSVNVCNFTKLNVVMSTVKNHAVKTMYYAYGFRLKLFCTKCFEKKNKKIYIVFSKLVNHDFNNIVEFKSHKIWWNILANTCAKSKSGKLRSHRHDCMQLFEIAREARKNICTISGAISGGEGTQNFTCSGEVGEGHPKFTCSRLNRDGRGHPNKA